MTPNHTDWDAYCDEMERRQDARADALENEHDPNPDESCDCGEPATTPLYSQGVWVRDACVDCAMSFAPVLTEPLPRRIDR